MKKLIIILLMLINCNAFAWSDKEKTHYLLTDYVVTHYFTPEQYKLLVNGQTFIDLIRQGSDLEDQGSDFDFATGKARSLNHFHAPTKPLVDAGLTDLPLPYLYGKSAMQWAQDADYQKTKVGGDWSWKMVRDLYYKSLTTTDRAIRELWQADYLKGLGFQMHLIEDMSQPNHVRNDTHIEDGGGKKPKNGFETWAKVKPDIIRNILDAGPIPVVTVNLLPKLAEDTSLAPVARLIDTRDNLSGGVITPSASMDRGLAEFTNTNFFSEDTTFADGLSSSNKQHFPYPRKSETNLQDFIDNYLDIATATDVDGTSYSGFIINKHNTTGVSLDCLAKPGPNTKNYYNEFGEGSAFYTSFLVDEECFVEHANYLFPRAVGYSAALLDYFFRGKLEATLSSQTPSTPTTMHFMVKNSTPGEAMTGGKLALVLRYKQLTETATSLDAPAADSPYSYQVVELTGKAVGTGFAEYRFDLAQPLPQWTTDLAYQIVYRGVLGNEQDSVAVSPWKMLQHQPLEIALSLPSGGAYGITAGGTPFKQIKVKARGNISSGKTLTNGSVTLYLLHRTAASDPFQSMPVEPTPATGYSLIKAIDSTVLSIANNSDTELTFDISATPLPLRATDVYLYVIYRGEVSDGTITLPNAVVAGMLDISEPTPVDVFNNADKVCVNSAWYDAGTPATLALRDESGNLIAGKADLYAHNIGNIYYKASASASPPLASTTNYTISSPATLTGNSKQTLSYILTDYSFSYSNLEEWFNVDPGDPWTTVEPAAQYVGTAVKNQTDTDGNYTYPSMFTIRGNKMWWGAGVVYDNNNATPQQPDCSWSTLP